MLGRAQVLVRGLVQGVGFRPFIYTIAMTNSLKGYVLNLGDAGVEIVVEGEKKDIFKFIDEITTKKPNVAKIDVVDVTWNKPLNEFERFKIAESSEKKLTVRSVIPTDLSICDNCITDIYRKSRWCNYPFTSCAQCGPRFTIINKLPYDRQNTSMAEFPFCPDCQSEYDNPIDRRYDAQGVTCQICGPQLELLDKNRNRITCEPLSEAAKLLCEGFIVAVKGIGGFHIAADASNEDVVKELRKRRIRPYQPFAVMSRSIEKIKNFAIINKKEQEFLMNVYHPIVTLKKSEKYCLAESVSPGLDSIGVMLPYSGIHLLLLDNFDKEALIMTSGNYPGKPIFIKNNEALNGLNNIVDYFLIHNRNIINRCDDSVLKVVENVPIFLRKSRGYAPSFLPMPWNVEQNTVLAVGGEFNVTGSIAAEDRLITTQHVGDTEDIETLDYLKKALSFIMKNYNVSKISCVAHDLNPSFSTTRYAKELSEELKSGTYAIQHHHAHLASLLADNSKPKESDIICIAIDGVGYGLDGMAWGGEIFLGGYSNFERLGQLKYQPMPGGDLCAKYPVRMLAGILSTFMSNSEIIDFFSGNYDKHLSHGLDELQIILNQSKVNNVLKTSSLGRLLDSIAALLNICWLRTYEGEPPMRLEGFAKRDKLKTITLRLPVSQHKGKYTLNTSEFMLSLIENINKNKRNLAYEAQKLLGQQLATVACNICDENGVNEIGVVGGSAVNSILFSSIESIVNKRKKQFLFYRTIPPGDGGISTGQALVASSRI